MDTGEARWVEIQQNTFKNWINEELKGTPEYEVKDIQSGFQNGLALLALLKKLHTKSSTEEDQATDSTVQALVPVHKNPKNSFEMRENLDRCLNFMKEQKFNGIKSTGELVGSL